MDRAVLQGHAQSEGALLLDESLIEYSPSVIQISVHTADVKQVLRIFSIEVPAREKDDLKEDPIIVKLRKVYYRSLQLSLLGY